MAGLQALCRIWEYFILRVAHDKTERAVQRLSKPELPHSWVYLPTPTPRPTVFTSPIVHILEYTVAKICNMFMVPGSTPTGLDVHLVRWQSLKSKLAFAKQINNANKVCARRIH
jgi:hypothetical protein